jgi:hypothetical protein
MNELNDAQAREYNRAKKLNKFLLDQNAVWTGYGPFKKRVIAFRANLTIFTDLVPVKEQSGVATTLTKTQLKLKIANETGDFLSKSLDYAIDNSNTTMEAQVHFSADDILHFKDSEILGFLTNLNTNTFTSTLMADADFITYEVTATDIATALTDAGTFNELIGNATVINTDSSVAGSDIDAVITLIRTNIASMLRLIVHFNISNPAFIEAFDINSKKANIGVHHTGSEGQITIGGVSSEKGTVAVGSKTVGPDILGHYSLIKVRPGNRRITATVPGLAPKSIIHHFISGQIDNIDFDF